MENLNDVVKTAIYNTSITIPTSNKNELVDAFNDLSKQTLWSISIDSEIEKFYQNNIFTDSNAVLNYLHKFRYHLYTLGVDVKSLNSVIDNVFIIDDPIVTEVMSDVMSSSDNISILRILLYLLRINITYAITTLKVGRDV